MAFLLGLAALLTLAIAAWALFELACLQAGELPPRIGGILPRLMGGKWVLVEHRNEDIAARTGTRWARRSDERERVVASAHYRWGRRV